MPVWPILTSCFEKAAEQNSLLYLFGAIVKNSLFPVVLRFFYLEEEAPGTAAIKASPTCRRGAMRCDGKRPTFWLLVPLIS
jgi:hypothetical protein